METSTEPAKTATQVQQRILLPLLVYLAAGAIAVLASRLPFIHEWTTFQWVTISFACLGAFAASIWLIVGIWKESRQRLRAGFRWVLLLAGSFVVLCLWFFASVGSLLYCSNGPLQPIYVQQFEFPAYETTIYVFEKIVPEYEIIYRIRRGRLPFTQTLGEVDFGYDDPQDFDVTQDGEWAVGRGIRVYLPTGEPTLSPEE